jgi:hypothetical protein
MMSLRSISTSTKVPGSTVSSSAKALMKIHADGFVLVCTAGPN